jgi:hypothetical protein
LKKKKEKQQIQIEKEEFKKIPADEFDSVVRTILSAPPQTKKKKEKKLNS